MRYMQMKDKSQGNKRKQTEQESRHRISFDDELRIREYIQNRLQCLEDDTEEEKEKKRQRQQRWDEFNESRSLKETIWYERSRTKFRRMAYEELLEVCEYSGCTMRELVDAVSENAELRWTSETDKQMAEVADSLSAEEQESLLQMVQSITPSAIRDVEKSDKSKNAAYRVFSALWLNQVSNRAVIRKREETGLTRLLNMAQVNQWPVNALPLNLIPTVCQTTGLSPHWVLAMPENIPLLCRTATADCIMDYYCLLPESWQSIIRTAYVEERGEIICGPAL